MAPPASHWLGQLDRENERIQIRKVANKVHPTATEGEFISGIEWLRISDFTHPHTKKLAAAFRIQFSKNARPEELVERALRACRSGHLYAPINATVKWNHPRGGGEWTGHDDQETHEDDQDDVQEEMEGAKQLPPPPPKDEALSVSGVDEDQVRAIAQEVTDKSLIEYEAQLLAKVQRPNVIMVTVNGSEPRKIQGLAHFITPKVIQAVNTGINVMLVGPAGTGKSTIAEQCADALGLEYVPFSVDPSMMRDELYGYLDVNGRPIMKVFYDAYKNGKLFCLDEMDNGHASILGGLNQAIAGSMAQFPHELVRKHENFRMIATANTYGTGPDSQYVGRSQLDAATLDRFTRLMVPIDESIEYNVAHSLNGDAETVDRWIMEVRRVRANVDRHGLKYVVSPRATFDGVKLLGAGWSWDECRESRLFAGMTADTRRKADER